jgi:hypothetical protein
MKLFYTLLCPAAAVIVLLLCILYTLLPIGGFSTFFLYKINTYKSGEYYYIQYMVLLYTVIVYSAYCTHTLLLKLFYYFIIDSNLVLSTA